MAGRVVTERIKRDFEAMPQQMQIASRFILDHPGEVALLSMRELARRAGVTAATMTRLAQRLGYSGYEELRSLYADDLRDSSRWFTRAAGMLSRREEVGEEGLVGDMAATLSGYVTALAGPEAAARFAAAADTLIAARRIFCVGARASFPVAYLFSYVQHYFWDRTRLLDAPGSAGIDGLLDAGPGDVLFAVSFDPYARSTLDAVELAARVGCPIVAITDSELSLIGRRAQHVIVVPKHSPSFFDTITPAFAAAEILTALLASRLGPEVQERVRAREEKFLSCDVWASDPGETRGERRP